MIAWQFTRSCMNNNMVFVIRNRLLRPFYISYNTCIGIRHIDTGNAFSLFSDFHKAFDCVSHEIQLSKLSTYGIRGSSLDWFRSYIKNREQYVCINNVNSNPKTIQCGVPQRSILGPLIF